MSDDLLRHLAAELNFAPDAADRAARYAALVNDTNRRIADAAQALAFDSSPYALPLWFAAMDKP